MSSARAVEKGLLWYVDRLTRPIHDAVRYSDGVRSQVAHTDRPPLLEQLRNAVHGARGRHAGSGSGADRMPFNIAAFDMYERIDEQIAELFVSMLNQPVYAMPERNLSEWYLWETREYRAGRVSEETEVGYRRLLASWVAQIEGMFDPPVELELTVDQRTMTERSRTVTSFTGDRRTTTTSVEVVTKIPATCPECLSQYGLDPSTGDRRFALVASYRETDPGVFGPPRVTCRACDKVWEGREAVKALIDSLGEEPAA